MINGVTTTIVACVVLGNRENGTGYHRQSRTLLTVHPITATVHTVDIITEAAPGPRTFPNSDPLWRVVIRTVMVLGMVHPAPTVTVSSKGHGMMDQGLW